MHTAMPVIEDLGAFKIAIDSADDAISKQVREQRWYIDEEWETKIFASCLRPGMRVLDIGGNIGFYALLARSVVGSSGRIVTFEPYPHSAHLIRTSITANAYENVTLVEAAVSDRIGREALYISPDGWTEHTLLDLGYHEPGFEGLFKLEVPVTTVDAALDELGEDLRFDFIKMDIEGGEWRALRGLARVLESSPSVTLMTEFWPGGFPRAGGSAKEFLQLLSSAGFSFQNMNEETERLEPMSLDVLLETVERNAHVVYDDPTMQKWGWYTNLLCMRSGSSAR